MVSQDINNGINNNNTNSNTKTQFRSSNSKFRGVNSRILNNNNANDSRSYINK